MRTIIIILLSLFALHAGAQVTLWGAKDNSMPNSLNIGAGKVKATNPKAYLELGDSIFSKKGFLPPRGWKDSIINPVKGLYIHDIPSNKPYWYNGTAWQQFGGGSSADSVYRQNDSLFYKKNDTVYSLGAFVDTLYQGDELDLKYRIGGVEHSLWGAFMNLYNSDGEFASDRQIEGAGYSWTNSGFRKYLFLTNNVDVHKSFSEWVSDEYGSSLKMAYNDPLASGTNNYLSFSHISQKPQAGGKSYLDLYGMRQTGPASSTRMHNHITVYPDSTVFAAYSNENTLRSLTVKWYGLQRGTASTDSLLVKSADGTTKVRALTDAGTSTPTPNLQAVATAGNTTTTPIIASSFQTSNGRTQMLENGTSGALFLFNNLGAIVGYFAGNTVGASHLDLYQADPNTVTTIGDAGRLFANSIDSARPYWKDKYGNTRKIAFVGESSGNGGGNTTDSVYRSNDTIYYLKNGFTYNLGTYLTKNGADLIYSALGHNHDDRYPQLSGSYSNPSWITGLDAGKLTTGTVAPARLGSGTPSASTVLYGNGTWGTPSVPLTASYVGVGTGTGLTGYAGLKYVEAAGTSAALQVGTSTGSTPGMVEVYTSAGTKAAVLGIENGLSLRSNNYVWVAGISGSTNGKLSNRSGAPFANSTTFDWSGPMVTNGNFSINVNPATSSKMLIGYTTSQNAAALQSIGPLWTNPQTSDPTGVDGMIDFNSTSGKFKGYRTGWKSFLMEGDVVTTSGTPTGTGDTSGTTGEIRYDDNYMYIKTGAGWKRSALSNF